MLTRNIFATSCWTFNFIAAALLTLCAASSTTAQYMGSYGYNYDDGWMVGSNQPIVWADGSVEDNPNGPPVAYFRGSGIYEESYNSYGHRYKVTGTLRSPDNRWVSHIGSDTGNYSGPNGGIFARADMYLNVNVGRTFYAGLYRVEHYTSGYCPSSSSYYNSFGAGGSSIPVTVGFSISKYWATFFSGNRITRCRPTSCEVYCPYWLENMMACYQQVKTRGEPTGTWAVYMIGYGYLFGNRVCANVVAEKVEIDTEVDCLNAEGTIPLGF